MEKEGKICGDDHGEDDGEDQEKEDVDDADGAAVDGGGGPWHCRAHTRGVGAVIRAKATISSFFVNSVFYPKA